jgi:hypothetical protein
MAGQPFERDLSIGLNNLEQRIIEDVNAARGEVFSVIDPTEAELRASGILVLGRIAIAESGDATLIRHYEGHRYFPAESGFVPSYEHQSRNPFSRRGRLSTFQYTRGIVDLDDIINFQGSQGVTRLIVDGIDLDSYKRRAIEPYPKRRRF